MGAGHARADLLRAGARMKYVRCGGCKQLMEWPSRKPVPPMDVEILTLGIGGCASCFGWLGRRAAEPGFDANGSPVE